MKLAEALILRADQQKRVERLKARIIRNAKVQEGENPAEDPNQLLSELNGIADDLTGIIQNINHTNSTTDLDSVMTISQAITVRDILRLRHSLYRDLAQAATVTQDRSTKSEVKFKSTVKVTEIQESADDFARQHRELDAKIQAANWEVDLKEN